MFGVALDAVAILDELAEELPEGRAYIRDQLRRAANSVALNIATLFSSHKIERKTHADLAFRHIASTICAFRRVHLDAIAALFVQLVQISRRTELAKLGQVSFDGSKVQANASKHKAMSYDRMGRPTVS